VEPAAVDLDATTARDAVGN